MSRWMNSAKALQRLLNLLGRLGVSSTLISFDAHKNNYLLTTITGISLLFFVAFRINYLVKLCYLAFLILGGFPEAGLEFLDNMTVGFWVLVGTLIIIGETFWTRRYPFFEIVCAGWKIQNEVCQKVESPSGFQRTLNISVVKKAIFQLIIICIGTLAMAVQYTAAPKYPVFTGYIAKEDTPLYTFVFGLHEVGYLWTAWVFYGPVICISSMFGGQMSLILKCMTEELRKLPKPLRTKERDSESEEYYSPLRKSTPSSEPKARYDCLDDLLKDYIKLMAYMERLNEFCSYKFLFIHITAYIQMIGDVFIMIQILRSGDADFMTVFFYLEDCGVCMFMLFKCFKAMSTVSPLADEFVSGLRGYLVYTKHNRKIYVKVMSTIRPISLKIGPNPVGPWTVGNAMMVLLNYYIMAALW